MKWKYELDNLNRFKYLEAATDEDTEFVEIEKADFRKVICGFHGLKNGKIVEIGYTDEEKLLIKSHNSIHRIEELKQLLLESDWKVIVNSELVQAGLQPKYPNLHTERQVWRDEINQLEEALNLNASSD
jgi:hypothetical protein